MTQLISADIGRSESKFFSNNQKLKFKSIVGDWHERHLSTGGDYDVKIDYEYKSVNYFIGDLAKLESHLPREMTTESKIHEETKTLFIVGIALLSQDDNLAISTGLPVNLFNPSTRDQLVNLLKGTYTVTFLGNRPKKINIDKISVSPEGSGTYFYELKKRPELKQGRIRILNFGSRTINHLSIEDGNLVNRSSGTLNYGSILLTHSKMNPQEYIRRIIADLSVSWSDYNDDDIVIMSGGGIINLEPFIRKHFKRPLISSEPIFSDCYGLHEIAQARYGKLVAR